MPWGVRSVGNTGKSSEENEREYAEALNQLAGYLKDDFADLTQIQVLDLGCGQVHFTDLALQLRVAAYTGLDFASPHLDQLAQRYTGFEFVNADITETHPIFTRKYDAILLIDTVYHIVSGRRFQQLLRISRSPSRICT